MDFFNNKFPHVFKPVILSDITHFAKFINSTTEQIQKFNIPSIENEGIYFEEIRKVLFNLIINNLTTNVQNISHQNLGANIGQKFAKFSSGNEKKNVPNTFLLEFLDSINSDLLESQQNYNFCSTNFIVYSLYQSMHVTKQTLIQLNDVFNLLRHSIDLIHKRAQCELIALNIPPNLANSREEMLKSENESILNLLSDNSLFRKYAKFKQLSVVIEESEDSKSVDLEQEIKKMINVEKLIKIAQFLCTNSIGRETLFRAKSNKALQIGTPFRNSKENEINDAHLGANHLLVSIESGRTLDSLKRILSSSQKIILHKSSSSHKRNSDKQILHKSTHSVPLIPTIEIENKLSFQHLEPIELKKTNNVCQLMRSSKVIPIIFNESVECDKKLGATIAKTHLPSRDGHKLHSVGGMTLLTIQGISPKRKKSIDLKRTYNFITTLRPLENINNPEVGKKCFGLKNCPALAQMPSSIKSVSLIIDLSESFTHRLDVTQDGLVNQSSVVKLSKSTEVNSQSSKCSQESRLSFPYSVSFSSLPLDREDYKMLNKSLFNCTFDYYINLGKNSNPFISMPLDVYHFGATDSIKSKVSTDSGISTQNSLLGSKLKLEEENSLESNEKLSQFCLEDKKETISDFGLEKPSPTSAVDLLKNIERRSNSSLRLVTIQTPSKGDTVDQNRRSNFVKAKSKVLLDKSNFLSMAENNFGKHLTGTKNEKKNSNETEIIYTRSISHKEIRILKEFRNETEISDYNYGKEKNGKAEEQGKKCKEEFQLHIPVKYFNEGTKEIMLQKKGTFTENSRVATFTTPNPNPSICYFLRCLDDKHSPILSKERLKQGPAISPRKNSNSKKDERNKNNPKANRAKSNNCCKPKKEEAKKCLKEKYADVQKANKDEFNWLLKRKISEESVLYNSDTRLLLKNPNANRGDKLCNSECLHLPAKTTNLRQCQRKNVKEYESKQSLLNKMSETGNRTLIKVKNCKSSFNIFRDSCVQRNTLWRSGNSTNICLPKKKNEDKKISQILAAQSKCLCVGKFNSKLKTYKSAHHKCDFVVPNYCTQISEVLPHLVSLAEFCFSFPHLNFCNGSNLNYNPNSRLPVGVNNGALIVRLNGDELTTFEERTNKPLVVSQIQSGMLREHREDGSSALSVVASKAFTSAPFLSFNNSRPLSTTGRNCSPLLKFAANESDSECDETKSETWEGVSQGAKVQNSSTKRKTCGKRCKDSKSNCKKTNEYWTVAKISVNSIGTFNINIVDKLPISVRDFLAKKYKKN